MTNRNQEALFRVQERRDNTIAGFIRDFSDIRNNNITTINGFPDLINVVVSQNDVKIRQQVYPAQGPLYELGFTITRNTNFNITIFVYQCPIENEHFRK